MNVRMSLKIARRGLHKNNKATVLNHYLFGNLKPTSLCCRYSKTERGLWTPARGEQAELRINVFVES